MSPLPKPTHAYRVAYLRRHLEDGHAVGVAEHVKRMAPSESNPDFLRELVALLADAIIAPKARRASRPTKRIASTNGVIDLDSIPPLTTAEKADFARKFRDDLATLEMCEQVLELHNRKKVAISTACELVGIDRRVYYTIVGQVSK